MFSCNFSFLWTFATCIFRFSLNGALWQQSFTSLFFKSSCPIIYLMICFLGKSVKLRYSDEQKKYDLSNNVFCKCRITVWAFVSFILLMWGRNVIFQIMFSANIASHCRHFSLLFWCGEDMWSLKLVFAVNIESQCRHLQGLLWIMIQNRDNNCFLVIFPFYEL